MAITTVQEVQEALGIKGKEEQIDALIPHVEEFIKGYCNIDELPNEYKINVIKIVEYFLEHKPGISGESLSRHSVQFLHSIPPIILKGLRRKLRW